MTVTSFRWLLWGASFAVLFWLSPFSFSLLEPVQCISIISHCSKLSLHFTFPLSPSLSFHYCQSVNVVHAFALGATILETKQETLAYFSSTYKNELKTQIKTLKKFKKLKREKRQNNTKDILFCLIFS